MVARTSDDDANTIIENKSQLVAYLESGCKASEKFRLGTELELFVFRAEEFAPAEYDSPSPCIRDLLNQMLRFGWTPTDANDLAVGLTREGCTITLEPGGQFEFSSPPLSDVHHIFEHTKIYQNELKSAGSELGLSFLAMGHQPKHARLDLPWMPKERYRIMRDYMPKRGSLGLDMMQSTASLQVAIDFASEADMVQKFRVALALQPVVTALFANSPFVKGQPSGYLSYRAHIWKNTDNDRSGSLPFVFETDMGFERYTDYVLDVPMYFVHRDGRYIDATGSSFRDFLAGQLSVLPGERPRLQDWIDHLTTVFPSTRLKTFLEMRGADAGPGRSRSPALAALWTGILYDPTVLDAAWERIRTWTNEERLNLELGVPIHGFDTPFREGTVRDLCQWILDLAKDGLDRRALRNTQGEDETKYLEPLFDAVREGRTFAEELLQRFDQEWSRDIDRAVRVLCEETLT
ncbi:MAG: glutamate--cysteine ligase [Gemmataceae bacterium]